MTPDLLFPLLSNGVYEKTVYMEAMSVATVNSLRFMLVDLSFAVPPIFVLNIVKLAGPYDLVGEHVGQPIKIDKSVVENAVAQGEALGLDDLKKQAFIMSHVLANGRIIEKLATKFGGCPSEVSDLFSWFNALDEGASLSESIGPTQAVDVKARSRL